MLCSGVCRGGSWQSGTTVTQPQGTRLVRTGLSGDDFRVTVFLEGGCLGLKPKFGTFPGVFPPSRLYTPVFTFIHTDTLLSLLMASS